MCHGKVVRGALAGLTLLVGGCGPEDIQRDGQVATAFSPASLQVCGFARFDEEPELYGTIYHGGARACESYAISLQPHADAQANLHYGDPDPAKNYDSNMNTDPLFAIEFGWWDPDQGTTNGTTGCSAAGISQYVANGSTAIESHGHGGVNGAPWDWNNGDGGGGSGKEGHCVRPGTYTFQAEGSHYAEFQLDYIQVGHAPNQLVQNQSVNPSRTEYVELSTYDALEAAHDLRVILDFPLDGNRGSESATELQIQNAGSNPQNTVFVNDPNSMPTGTASSWFRFSVGASNATWFGPDSGTTVSLARLFWDENAPDPTPRTGYYDLNKYGRPVIRVHRYPNPPQKDTVRVGLEIKRPDESPAAGPTVTRDIEIDRLETDLDPNVTSVSLNGVTLTVNVTERNIAPSALASEPGGWRGTVYLSQPGVNIYLGEFIENSVIPGGGGSISRSYQYPVAQVPGGTYSVTVKLDDGSAVPRSEINDLNNAETYPTQVTINGPCAMFERTTTWKNTDQLFTACSTPGSNLEYKWQTQTGGAWTTYSTSPIYEFLGHNTSGTKSVTLRVRNPVTSDSASTTYTFTVQNSALTISGPTEVYDKLTKTYTSSSAAYWYERFLPSAAWAQITPNAVTSIQRAWSSGCYTALLRADISTPTVLKRARKQVLVENQTGGCP